MWYYVYSSSNEYEITKCKYKVEKNGCLGGEYSVTLKDNNNKAFANGVSRTGNVYEVFLLNGNLYGYISEDIELLENPPYK